MDAARQARAGRIPTAAARSSASGLLAPSRRGTLKYLDPTGLGMAGLLPRRRAPDTMCSEVKVCGWGAALPRRSNPSR